MYMSVCHRLLVVFFVFDFQELKLKYYRLMIELCHHEKKYLSICQHYRAVFNTPKVKENIDMWKEVD